MGLGWSAIVDARLRISRLSGWGRYKIVLDGGEVGAVCHAKNFEMEVASGAHTLELVYRLGLGSAVEAFSVRAGETAAFVCRPPSFVAAIPRLVAVALLHRGSWIALERTGHHAGGGDASAAEDQGELIKQIQAGSNQPGLPH
jgi:hypothetical protein